MQLNLVLNETEVLYPFLADEETEAERLSHPSTIMEPRMTGGFPPGETIRLTPVVPIFVLVTEF